MKKRITKRWRIMAVMAGLLMLGSMIWAEHGIAAAESEKATIVFTHDLHSHLDSFQAQLEGREQEVGGVARLKTFMDQIRQEDPDTLFVDGGDFAMGTLYQTVFESQAAELRMLGYLGVDVTTMGNHEFDYRSQGLTNMLNTAVKSGEQLPQLVLCNVDWEATLAQGEASVEQLKEAFDGYGIQDYVMVEKGDLKIAVLGIFGKDALACTPTCELIFRDPVEAAKETVAQIQQQEDADMIVCVSHSGTWPDPEESEDEILAKEVPELDVIISAHTHTILQEPIVHGNTIVASTGEYGIRAGKMTLIRREDGRWGLESYELEPMTREIGQDQETQERIIELGNIIDTQYLKQFGYTRDQVLAYNPWENPSLSEIYNVLSENAFTNLLADAYRHTINSNPDMEEEPVAVAVVPSGVIRDVFPADKDITVSDVYNVFSLGIGPDGVPGYPLISIYLTGAELRTAAEVDASISSMMTTAQLFTSGLNYTLNPNRLILNKVTEVSLCDMEGNIQELEDDKLYRVVADLYSGQMLGAVSEKSFGILSIVPKDAQGNPVEDLEAQIIHVDGQELKAWVAIARYVEYLGDIQEDGAIPSYYSQTHDRKIIEDDPSLGAILKSPNKIALVLSTIVVGVVLILILVIVLIVRRICRRKKKSIEKR